MDSLLPEKYSAASDSRTSDAPLIVSTSQFPDEDPFEAWRETVRRLVGAECTTATAGAFRGTILMRAAGPARITHWNVDESRYERTASLAEHGEDCCTLTISHGGDTVMAPAMDRARIDSGGAFFLAHDRPFTVTASGAAPSSVVVVDRSALASLLPAGTGLKAERFAPGNPVLELIKGYTRILTDGSGSRGAHAVNVMGEHVVDLIALLLRPSHDAIEVIAGRGLKAARTQAVLDAIARHHAEPDLSAEMVGRELGVSARQVHRLLEETPKTFYEHLLERRLCRAHELLAGSAGAGLPIAEVARRCGFVAVSHFGRCFATRFGATPSAIRARALN